MKKIFVFGLLFTAASAAYAEEAQVRQLDSIFMNAPKAGAAAGAVALSESPAVLDQVKPSPAQASVPKPYRHGAHCCQKRFTTVFRGNDGWFITGGLFAGLVLGAFIGGALASGWGAAVGALVLMIAGAWGGHAIENAIRRKNCDPNKENT